MRRLIALAACCMAVGSAGAQRAPSASYLVSGSSGNWTLNFELTSTFLTGEGEFYFFGVRLGTGRNIVGSPVSWAPTSEIARNFIDYGGSNTIYNNNWVNFVDANRVLPGASKAGFKAVSTEAVAPTSVQFFAFAVGGTYGGGDNFNNQANPGFEGIAIASPVPEPLTLSLAGLALAAAARRRLRRAA